MNISAHTRTRPRTREQAVGSTEALARKLDTSARVKDKVQATKETMQATVAQAKQQLHKGTEKLQDKAAGATSQANNLHNQALAKIPAPTARHIEQLMGTARQLPVPAAVAVLAVLLVALRLLLRKGR